MKTTIKHVLSTYCFSCAACIFILVICSAVSRGQSRNSEALDSPPNLSEAGADASVEAKLIAQIDELIQQLGADSYATRENAKSRLREIGLVAFEKLRAASFDADPQIAASSLYLMQSIRQLWSWPSDSFEVHEILDGYSVATVEQRIARIQRLTTLSEEEAIIPLCRIVRYETNEDLSMRALLQILKRDPDPTDPDKGERSAMILQSIGDSNRQTAKWLRAYCDFCKTNEIDPDNWQLLIDEIQKQISDDSPTLSRYSVMQLHRWYAKRLQESGFEDKALATAHFIIDLLEENSAPIFEFCQWAIDAEIYQLVVDTAGEYREIFDASAVHGYLEAEVLRKLGDGSTSDAKAEEILNRTTFGTAPTISERYRVADHLQNRQMFDWSVKEYELALEDADLLNRETPRVIISFCELLADLDDYERAAAEMSELVEKIESVENFRQQLDSNFWITRTTYSNLVLSRHYFFSAKSALQKDDHERARAAIKKSIAADSTNSDTLIAAYRINGDDKWRQRVDELILRAHDAISERILSAQREIQEGNSGFQDNSFVLAQACNEYAWLFASIGQRLDEAKAKAKLAVQTDPKNSAYIDTLAVAYFADGNVVEAYRQQRIACKIDPSSQHMQRMLEKYRSALPDNAEE